MSIATLANPEFDTDRDLDALEPASTPTHEEGEFVVCENIPVWRAHTTRDGVKFGKSELEIVAKRCNERILETGDFCPIVIGHTDDEGDKDAPLVGMAGPFVVDRFGRDKSTWAIYAKKFRIFKSDYEKTRRYPRLSVEFWSTKKKPADGHFDPICLLGSETPQLDLGLRYSRRDGMERTCYSRIEHNPMCNERYAATAPSGANTFVPGDNSPKRYEADDQPADPKKPTKEASGMAISQEDIMQIVDAMKPVIVACIEEHAAGGLGDGLRDDAGAGAGMGDPSALDAAAPGAPIDPAAATPAAPPTAAPMDNAPPPGPPAAATGAATPPGDEDDDESKPAKYSAVQYRKERNDYRTRYQREVAARRDAETKLAEVSGKIELAEGEKRKAQRYSRLNELQSIGYNLNVDEELADTESMTDEKFGKHCDKIVERYERIPVGRRPIPMERPIKDEGAPASENEDLARRSRYSREARDEVSRRREKGEKNVDFFEVLAEIEKKNLNGQAATV